jgi:hypothetical protein
MRRTGELEAFEVGKPRAQKLQSLGESRGRVLSADADRGLGDPARVLVRERPGLEGGQFLREERVRVGDALFDGAGEPALEGVAVVGAEHSSGPGVDRTRLVSGAVALDGRLHNVAAERILELGLRVGPRRLHQRERVHRVGKLECEF